MDCFDIILAYTNMHTIFYEILKLKFSKKYNRNSCVCQIASMISICSYPCQPMILPIKFTSHVFCILAKFRDFLKPVTVQENTLYTCRHFFDIYHYLMFEACLFLEPCNFSILLLKIL